MNSLIYITKSAKKCRGIFTQKLENENDRRPFIFENPFHC